MSLDANGGANLSVISANLMSDDHHSGSYGAVGCDCMSFALHHYPSWADYSSLKSSILFCIFSAIILAVSHGSLMSNFTPLVSKSASRIHFELLPFINLSFSPFCANC